MDTTRDRTGRDNQERPGPLVIEHDHGLSRGREASRWTKFDGSRDQDPDTEQGRSPCPASSSQERFRTSNFRPDHREDARRRPSHEDWRGAEHTETRRSPAAQERGNNSRYGTHRGRSGPHPARGRYTHGQAGKPGPHRNQPPTQQGYQDLCNEETRPGLRPFREDPDPAEGEADWAEGTRAHEWKRDRPGHLDRHVPKIDLDPKMPRQRMQKWIDEKTSDMAAVVEETLTIKVDMSRPTVKNRWSMFYSVLRVRGESSHFCL